MYFHITCNVSLSILHVKEKRKALLSLLHKCPTFVAKQDACTCQSQWQVHVLSNCLTVQMGSSTIQYVSTSVRPNVYVIYNSCLSTIIAKYIEYEYQGARYILINRVDSMLPRICSVKWSYKTWQNVVKTLTHLAAFVSPCVPLFLFLPYFGVINYLTHLLHFDPY